MKATPARKALPRLCCLYALALLAPVIVVLVLLCQSSGRLIVAEEERLYRELDAEVKQTAMLIDEAVERAQTAAYSLWRGDSVSPFLRGGKGDQYRVFSQLNDLTLVNNRLIEDIALCFHPQALILTAAGRGTDEGIFQRFIADSMTQEEWLKKELGFTGGELICRKDGRLVFLQTYPVTPMGDRSRAALLILLRQALPDNTLLVDENTGVSLYGEVRSGWLTARKTSGRLPLIYAAQADAAPLEQYAAAQHRDMALVWALCLLGVLVLGYILARRQLSPLRRLATLARGESAALPMDPYAEIRIALMDAAQQRLSLMAIREESAADQRLRLLLTALNDPALDNGRLIQYMRAAGLPTEDQPLCLARLRCTDVDTYLLSGEAEQDPLSLAGEMVKNLLTQRWMTRAVGHQDAFWFFILPDEKQLEGFSGQVSGELNNTKRLLAQAYGMDTELEQSALFMGVKGLKAAFAEITEFAPQPDNEKTRAEPDSGLCRRAADAVAAHYADPDISVALIAMQLGYSTEYLSRAFKKETGQGLLTYIRGYQVERAKELLSAQPAQSVRRVAAMVGFSGSESFIRTFKRHTGVTPGRYQEERRGR